MANEPKIDLDNPWTPVQEVITCNPDLASFDKTHEDSELLMHEVISILYEGNLVNIFDFDVFLGSNNQRRSQRLHRNRRRISIYVGTLHILNERLKNFLKPVKCKCAIHSY